MAKDQKKYWIIGASSGIGAALAKELARQGHQLVLSARREEALQELVGELDGHSHSTVAVDITQLESVQQGFEKAQHHLGKVDSVICMAGTYTPMSFGEGRIEDIEQTVKVNLTGALYVAETVVSTLLKQKNAQFVLCGSVVSFCGLPHSQPYSATKAGIASLAESLRAQYGSALDVKLISPGFVTTSMTDKNNYKMPMIITAEKAGAYIAKGLKKKRFEIHFPKQFTIPMKILGSLPYWLYFSLMKSRF